MNTYGSVLGFQAQTADKILIILKQLLEYAPLQLTAGIAAAILLARRFGYISFAFLAAILIWMFSIGKTGGGYFWTLRVLSPALVIGSVLAAVYFEPIGSLGSRQFNPLSFNPRADQGEDPW